MSRSTAKASISGNSVVPGLPNRTSTPSCFRSSRKARFPEMRGMVRSGSIGFRQAEHPLGDEVQDHVRADRSDARNEAFAEVALDRVLLRIAHAAMGQDRLLAGHERGLGGEVFGRVRLGAALRAAVVEACRLEHHKVCGLELGPAFRERMLDGLVLADRAAEDDPLAGVQRRTPERRAADADRLRRDQDALGIHAVQDRAEAVEERKLSTLYTLALDHVYQDSFGDNNIKKSLS